MSTKNRIIRLAAVLIMMGVMLSLRYCEGLSGAFGGMFSVYDNDTSVDNELRLPSVPAELWGHVFLSGREQGSCLKLCGTNAFLCVFVNDGESVWTDAAREAAMLGFDAASQLLTSEAARYGVELSTVFTYVEGSAEDTESDGWIDKLMADVGYGSEASARERIMADAQAENSAVVLCYNTTDYNRSHAELGMSRVSVENMFLYEFDDITITHEIYHLFGARDLYYPDEVKEAAKRIFGDSVMSSDVPVVDPLTAYAVGWTDQVSDDTLEFLNETANFTPDQIAAAGDYDSYTGYVENRRFDGYIYTGYLKDGVVNGTGKITFDSGDIYEGTFVAAKLNGNGTRTWANGSVYTGDFVNSVENGTGTIRWANGNVYEGEWLDGKIYGQGTFTWASGDVYEGEWLDGKHHGQGTFTWANGNVYEGEWLDGKRHGQGTYTWTNGDVYEGEWLDGKRHGQGTFTWADGTVYEGYYENDQRNGYGKITYSNGNVLEGTWSNGSFVG